MCFSTVNVKTQKESNKCYYITNVNQSRNMRVSKLYMLHREELTACSANRISSFKKTKNQS